MDVAPMTSPHTPVDAQGGAIGTADAAAVSSVAASVTPTVLLAANPNAEGRMVYNDSTADLYLKYGAGVSTSSFTVKVAPGALYEFPLPLHLGVVEGMWSAATGAARITEQT